MLPVEPAKAPVQVTVKVPPKPPTVGSTALHPGGKLILPK